MEIKHSARPSRDWSWELGEGTQQSGARPACSALEQPFGGR